MIRFGLLLAVMTTAGLLLACGDDSEPDGGPAVRAVVTLPVIADVAEEVGGERVDVEALLPAGADPHTFEPVPSDVALIAEADIVFANGLGLEEATLELIEANLPDGVPLVELGEVAGEGGYVYEGENPHLWLDPEAMKEYANIIRESLSRVDTEGATDYGERYEAYWDALDEVQQYLVDITGAVPEKNRVLVTTHDAFPYLARAIGFEVGAVVTVSPGQEPSPQAVAELAQAIEETGVPAVFREPQLGSEADVLEQAASDAGVDVCILYSASAAGEAGTYIQIVRHNADEIARCLGGSE